MGDFGIVALYELSRLKQDLGGKLFFVLTYRNFGSAFQPIMTTSG